MNPVQTIAFAAMCACSFLFLSCPPSQAPASPSEYSSPDDPADLDPDPDRFGVTIDPKATANARKLYAWLQSLPGRTENRVVSCQHIGDDLAIRGYDLYMRALAIDTGMLPAMVGFDYFKGVSFSGAKTADTAGKTDIAIRHWAEGGLVTVSIHLINPWTGGDSRDASNGAGTYEDAYTPGTSAYGNLKADFDLLADEFLKLQGEKVAVLFRPFHEMNGVWFWWHNESPDKFKALWRCWQDYLMSERGVHNLIYVFSPNAATPYAPTPGIRNYPRNYYPGDDRVDVIALDAYHADLRQVPAQNYTELKAAASAGKPFGLGEFGQDFNYPYTDPEWDQRNMLAAIESNFPDAVFWQSWASWSLPETPVNMAIVDLPYARELMEDPFTIDASEVDCALFRDAARAYVGFFLETPEAESPARALIATSERESQRWEYSFDGVEYGKSMAPFGSPWITTVPVPPRFCFKFEGARDRLWLRKEFLYDGSPATDLILRVYQLGNDATFSLNGTVIHERGRTHETEPGYTDISLGAAGLSALRAGANTLEIHCRQNLPWGDVQIDVGIGLR